MLYIECIALFIPECMRYMCGGGLRVKSIKLLTGPAALCGALEWAKLYGAWWATHKDFQHV